VYRGVFDHPNFQETFPLNDPKSAPSDITQEQFNIVTKSYEENYKRPSRNKPRGAIAVLEYSSSSSSVATRQPVSMDSDEESQKVDEEDNVGECNEDLKNYHELKKNIVNTHHKGSENDFRTSIMDEFWHMRDTNELGP